MEQNIDPYSQLTREQLIDAIEKPLNSHIQFKAFNELCSRLLFDPNNLPVHEWIEKDNLN